MSPFNSMIRVTLILWLCMWCVFKKSEKAEPQRDDKEFAQGHVGS